MKKTKNMKCYRQGDVLIIPTTKIPANLVKTKKVTLAYGEVTGHHHTIFSGAVGYGKSADSLVDYFEVTTDDAQIVHQEHDPIKLPAGTYRSVIQVEYTPEAIRNVQD